MTKTFAWAVTCALAMPLLACSTSKTFVVLLPDERNAATAVTIGEGAGASVLDAPMSAATVDNSGNVHRAVVSQEEMQKIFGEAMAAQPPQSISFTLYFDTASTEVTQDSRATLEALFAEVARRQAVEVQVTGHTDRVGTDANNDRLSLERAQAVREMLVQRGLKATFVRAVGRGEREPLVPTPDEQPEPRNRRVEVIVR
jgi:outer membrane protein OmpA-like peptidoglycan-associated protein